MKPRGRSFEGASVVGCDLTVVRRTPLWTWFGPRETMVSQPCQLTQASRLQALVDRGAHVRADRHVVQQRAMAYFNWLEDITDEVGSRSSGRSRPVLSHSRRGASEASREWS